jgi:6-pyruvoyltetrahydropterin/6-carboxytetrahydropterin synthase
MVMNLVDLDRAIDRVIAPLDHRFLNEECQDLLRGRQPSTEILSLVLWEQLANLLRQEADSQCRLVSVRLAETDTLWAEAAEERLPMIRFTRSYTFSAAHRLAHPALDAESNSRLYGKCANPYGHGHDYRLDVTVLGEPDPRTGMVVDLVDLDRAVHDTILEPWDHRHFNHEVPPFDTLVPTSENIVRTAWEHLQPRLGERLEKLTLYETPRGSFEYRGSASS